MDVRNFVLISTSLFYIVINGSEQTERLIYNTSRLRMCRENCQVLRKSLCFLEEFQCHRLPTHQSNSRENTSASPLSCRRKCHLTVESTSWPGASGLDVDNSSSNGAMSSGVIPGLTSEPTTVGNIDLVQCNRLFAACTEGKLTVVQNMLSKAPEYINCRRRARITPVLGAVVKGHLEVFNFLLKKGCDLSVTDAYNNTVLHVACKGGNTEIVQQLVDNLKCDKERRGKYGMTPLLSAAYYGRKEVLIFLVNRDCNISAVDRDGNNNLHLACMAGHVDVVKYILTKSMVDIESVGLFGRTPILLAAWTGQIKVFKVLANAHCNWKAVDRNNDTILHLACISRNIDLIRYILSENLVDIESRGYFGKTAAMLTAEFGLINVFSILVNESCNLRAVDICKNNIFHWACKGGHVDMVKYTLSLDIFDLDVRGCLGRTPIMTAVEAGYSNVADVLLSKGCNPKAIDDEGNTILHLACLGGQINIVKYVIELKVVDLEKKNIYGQTAAQVAAYDGYISIVALLK